MTMRDSLSKNHGISIMWEDISLHRHEEVDWDQLTPMELANCRYDAVAKHIMIFSVNNKWKPINRFLGKGWHCLVGPIKISG